jgi:hypothetical protein
MKNNIMLGLGFGALPNVYEEQDNARVRVWRSASERESEKGFVGFGNTRGTSELGFV